MHFVSQSVSHTLSIALHTISTHTHTYLTNAGPRSVRLISVLTHSSAHYNLPLTDAIAHRGAPWLLICRSSCTLHQYSNTKGEGKGEREGCVAELGQVAVRAGAIKGRGGVL